MDVCSDEDETFLSAGAGGSLLTTSRGLADERSDDFPLALLLDRTRREEEEEERSPSRESRATATGLSPDPMLLMLMDCLWLEEVGRTALAVAFDDDRDFAEWVLSIDLGRLLLFDFFRLEDEEADESEDTGFGPWKVCDAS